MPLSVLDGLFSHPKTAIFSRDLQSWGLLLTDCRTARLLMDIEGCGLRLFGVWLKSLYR
jgi:hypothetical protein